MAKHDGKGLPSPNEFIQIDNPPAFLYPSQQHEALMNAIKKKGKGGKRKSRRKNLVDKLFRLARNKRRKKTRRKRYK